jgi:hypothetical protein
VLGGDKFHGDKLNSFKFNYIPQNAGASQGYGGNLPVLGTRRPLKRKAAQGRLIISGVVTLKVVSYSRPAAEEFIGYVRPGITVPEKKIDGKLSIKHISHPAIHHQGRRYIRATEIVEPDQEDGRADAQVGLEAAKRDFVVLDKAETENRHKAPGGYVTGPHLRTAVRINLTNADVGIKPEGSHPLWVIQS